MTATKTTPSTKVVTNLKEVQVNLLKTLAKSNKPLTLRQWADKAKTSYAPLTVYVGSLNEEKRAKNDQEFPCLLTLKLIKYGPDEEVTTYEITEKGRKTVTKLAEQN